MPIPLLIALLIAFGIDLGGPEVQAASVPVRLLQTAGGVLAVGLLAFGLGGWVVSRLARVGFSTGKIYRRYHQGARLLTLAGLGVYAWIIYSVGWSRLVLSQWGLQDTILIDDLAIIAPYVLIQLLSWSGLYLAERALHPGAEFPALPRYLFLKSRQALGLALPIILIFAIRQDVFARYTPEWHRGSSAESFELAVLSIFVLTLSPLFIRIAWPTRSLPDGPLRRRLERVARRAGFRFNDLLVWDTGNLMVNACVTGVLPWFRYVLLSDALLENLTPEQIAAVFGHEVGHVAHRHLPFFGFFFLGSLGALSIAAQFVVIPDSWIAAIPWVPSDLRGHVREAVEGLALLAGLGVFIWIVFGHLSRRFERQADVFGCKVVSCNDPNCPPHFDFEAIDDVPNAPAAMNAALCPVGIQTFCDALESVAHQSGMDISRNSWRHGSIGRRILFLRGLAANPANEPRFQKRVLRLRMLLALFLVGSFALAFYTGSWDTLR